MAGANNGLFVWYEHLTRDAAAAIAFYTDVVGWKTRPFAEAGDYTMWVGSQGPMGGVMQLQPGNEAPPHWMGHVMVTDVDATAALAKTLGGMVLMEPMDIPTVGRFSVIRDPQGATLSIFASPTEMQLHDPSRDGEFCWSELLTSDQAAGFKFYANLFGWRILEEMDLGPMGMYLVFGLGERRLGGMMMLPPGGPMPPTWLYYVNMEDLDAALARAAKSGARLISGPVEIPGGGKVAQLADPQGALFALHQAPRAPGTKP